MLDPPGQDPREYAWNEEDHKNNNNNKYFKCDRQKVHLVTFKVDQSDFLLPVEPVSSSSTLAI